MIRNFRTNYKIIFKTRFSTKNVLVSNDIGIINLKDKESLPTDCSQMYYDCLNQHYKMRIPFSDIDYYTNLFRISIKIMNNQNLESWDILERYIILNYNYLEMSFLSEASYQFSVIKWSNFEFWYYIEKRLTADIKIMNNNQLSNCIYSFGTNDKGSNHLFNIFSDEVLDRKIRNFDEEEFKKIYLGFKSNKIRNKLLWNILDKAKLELNYNI